MGAQRPTGPAERPHLSPALGPWQPVRSGPGQDMPAAVLFKHSPSDQSSLIATWGGEEMALPSPAHPAS